MNLSHVRSRWSSAVRGTVKRGIMAAYNRGMLSRRTAQRIVNRGRLWLD